METRDGGFRTITMMPDLRPESLVPTLALLALLHVSPAVAQAAPISDPYLVVLTESGSEREGLPVLTPHPDGERIATELSRGIPAELTKVYKLLQVARYRTKGVAIEPAYLLLSTTRGGFARYGFWLKGERKDGVAYVDIHRDAWLSGRFAAVDQLFPHELSHAMFHQLGAEGPASAHANQLHAVGVRTDRFTAFNEGFAEHFQVMAVDHPEADPETRALAKASDRLAAARRHLAAYRAEMTARISPATRMQIGFPLWYTNDERVLRYFAVKANDFARQPDIPLDLLQGGDPYRAYLLENVLPGESAGEIRSVPRLLATEGAISSLFYRWATNESLQHARPDAAFYEAYGTTPDALTPLQNLYLKLFHVVGERAPTDALQLITAYRQAFPDEASAVDAVVAEAFMGQAPDAPPEIWLANASFRTGTSLFDQFRGVPRTHTFDLNAASLVDLASLPGVSLETALAIEASAPFTTLADLGRVPGVDDDLLGRLRGMNQAMESLDGVNVEDLSLTKILMPYVWRATGVIAIAALFGTIILASARRRLGLRHGWVRLTLGGLTASIAAVVTSWVLGNPLLAIGVVSLLYGLPALILSYWKTRQLRTSLLVMASWFAAASPGVLLTLAWFQV